MIEPRPHNDDSKEILRTNDSNSQIYIINADSVVSNRQPSVEFSKIIRQELNTVPEVQSSTLSANQAMDLKFIDIHMSQWNSKCSSIRSKLGPISENSDKHIISESPTMLKTARSVQNIILLSTNTFHTIYHIFYRYIIYISTFGRLFIALNQNIVFRYIWHPEMLS